jgi:hypothetical protein
MSSYNSPPVLHGVSLVHLMRHHIGSPAHESVVRLGDDLSGTKLWLSGCFSPERETELYLGLGHDDLRKTLLCFYLYFISAFSTQALSSLSILFASLLVILRV